MSDGLMMVACLKNSGFLRRSHPTAELRTRLSPCLWLGRGGWWRWVRERWVRKGGSSACRQGSRTGVPAPAQATRPCVYVPTIPSFTTIHQPQRCVTRAVNKAGATKTFPPPISGGAGREKTTTKQSPPTPLSLASFAFHCFFHRTITIPI